MPASASKQKPADAPASTRPELNPSTRPGRDDDRARRAGSARVEGVERGESPVLSAMHDFIGNRGVQAALSGVGSGPELLAQGALSLELAGVRVPVGGVFANSTLAAYAAPDAAPAGTVARDARGRGRERFPEGAGRSLAAARSRGGRPLPAHVRAQLEASFGGVDLSAVRLHADGAAARASRDLHARAFTVGTDIYFAAGAPGLESPEGRRLLAHELTHVVQFLEGRLRSEGGAGEVGGTRVSAPTDAAEREAEARAVEVARDLDPHAVVSSEEAPAAEVSEHAATGEGTGTATGGEALLPAGDEALAGGEPLSAVEAVAILAGEAPPEAVTERLRAAMGPEAAPAAPAPAAGAVLARDESTAGDDDKEEAKGTVTYHGQKISELSRAELAKIRFNEKGQLRYVTIAGELVPQDPGDVTREVFEAASDLYAGRDKMYLTGQGLNKWDLKKWDLHKPGHEARAGGTWVYDSKRGGVAERLLKDDEIKIKTARDGRKYGVYPGVDGKNAITWKRKTESEAEFKDRVRQKVNGERDILVKPPDDGSSKFKKWAKENVLANATVIDKRTRLAHAAWYEDEFKDQEGFLGSKAKGSTQVGSVDAHGQVKANFGPESASVNANVSAKAALLDFTRRWEWDTDPFTIAGEKLTGRFYLFVSGMIGAEAAAHIDANVKLLKGKKEADPDALLAGTGLEVDPATGKAKEAKKSLGGEAKASANAFVGAKATLGAGLAAYWDRKDVSEYGAQIAGAAEALFVPLYAVNPGLAWIAEQAGGVEFAEKMIHKFFDWAGAAAKVNLMGIEALVEGSVGIGGKVEAAVGFQHGKLTLTAAASGTVGVGLGSTVRINLDLLEGARFALIVGGVFEPAARKWVEQKVAELSDDIGDLVDGILDWFSADDKVRDAVAHRAHELVGPAERAKMIETMLSGFTGDDDEQAILTILEFSRKKGDLQQVLAIVPADDILWDLDGEEDTKARKILGVK